MEKKLVYTGENILYKGIYPGGREIAIKYIMYDDDTLEREVETSRKTSSIIPVNTPKILYYGRYFDNIELIEGEYPIGVIYFQWINGKTLQKLIEGKTLTRRLKKLVARQMIDITKILHENGITHQDMFPSNWMIDEKYNVYIIDFGGGSIVDSDIHYNLWDSKTLAMSLHCLLYDEEDWDTSLVEGGTSSFQEIMTINELSEVVEILY